MAAGVDDQRLRRQHASTSSSRSEPLRALRDQARRGRVEDEGSAFDLRRQRGMPRQARGMLGPGECRARRLRPQAPDRDPRNHQLVGGPRRGRERRGVEPGERVLGLIEAADQQQAPDLEIARMRGVPRRRALRASRARRRAPSQATPGRARPARSRPRRRRSAHAPPPPSDRRRAPRCAAEPSPARDRRAAPSRCRAARAPARRRAGQRVSARRAVARCECARRGSDQRVHRNPVTFVTLIRRCPAPVYL